MSLKELEAEALKLDPKARARLAGKLLESLEDLSEEENLRLWVEEASAERGGDGCEFGLQLLGHRGVS